MAPACKDCKHCVYRPHGAAFYGCMKLPEFSFDAFSGKEMLTHYTSIEAARKMNTLGCGHDGKWFEPRPPTRWQRLMTWLDC